MFNANPAEACAAVTPNDSTDLTVKPTRALYVGSGGTIVVRPSGSSTSITFSNVPTGSILPVRVDRVLSTGTTAASLIALY